jgi:morn variant repeat protein
MKYIWLFVLGIGTFWSVWGQELLSSNEIQEKRYGLENLSTLRSDGSLLNGVYKVVLSDDSYYEGAFVNGRPNGDFSFYNRNGKLSYVYPYQNGALTGVQKEYHRNGKLKIEEEVTKGLRTGFYREYTLQGALWREYHYKNGMLDGSFREFWDGKLFKDRQYKEDTPNGEWRDYYDGKLIAIEHYKMGKKDGQQWRHKYWDAHSGSGVFETEYYKEDVPVGLWEKRKEDGTIVSEKEFKPDSTSVYKLYHDNGKLFERIGYKSNKRHGSYLRYNDLGGL